MPDWIKLIISFVQKRMVSTTLGLLAFVFAYHYFGTWEEFKRPEFFWIVLALCLGIAFSISMTIEKIRSAVASARIKEQLEKEENARQLLQIEETIVNHFASLSAPIKFQIKKHPEKGFGFASTQELTIKELHKLGAITITGRTPWGLVAVLTETGAEIIRKRARDLY